MKKTFYNDNFFKQIKNILGSSANFIKSNQIKRETIFEKLKELSLLSEFTNTFKKDIDLSNFKKELSDFDKIYKEEMSKPIKRKDSSNMVNQLNLVVELTCKYITDNGYISKNIDPNEIISKLGSSKVFLIIINSYISSVKYIYLMDNYEDINIEPNQVDRFKVNRTLMNNLVAHVILLILEEDENKWFNFSIIYQKIPEIIHNKELSSCFVKFSTQLTYIFEHIFEMESVNISFNENNKIKTLTLVTLPNKLDDIYISPSHIPQIVKPKVDYDDIFSEINLSKKIKNGVSHVKLSSNTRKALDISQNKVFKINKNSLDLFKNLDEMPYDSIKNLDCLPFTPLTHLNKLKEDIDNHPVSNETYKSVSNFYYELKGTKKSILEELNISEEELNQCRELYLLKKEYQKRKQLRIIHNTIIKFAEIFDGFPIYFLNAFDYRLRMYPWNYMFNRTSGIYKYLLVEEKSTVKEDGLIVMIKAYYKDDPDKLSELENFENPTRDQLIKWFKRFEINKELQNDSFVYHILLGMEIENLKANKFRTGFLIEIDQKSSSSVLLSLLLGDKNLAEQSNLISGKESKDANKFIMDEAKNWYKDKLTADSYDVVCNERKLHKYLFMCSIYNQTFYGRMERIKEYLKNNDDQILIAKTYPDFINDVFPSLNAKKVLFNDIVRYYLKKSNESIEIETLDESLISWYIYKIDDSKNKKLKVVNPITNETKSVHYVYYLKDKLNTRKTIDGLIPSLIHSIDGAIMRMIIIDVYSKNKYIINHLHDSIQFHPNHYIDVISSIKKVYCSEKLHNILKTRFLNKIRNKLLREDCTVFDDLVKKLYESDFEEIDINENNINIESMFPFE